MTLMIDKQSTGIQADPGSVSLYPKVDGKWYSKDENNIEEPMASANPVFGEGYQLASNFVQSQINVLGWVDYISISPNILNAGKYRITTDLVFRYSNAGRDFQARLLVNGVQVKDILRLEQKDTGTDQRDWAERTFRVDLVSGVNDIKLQFQPSVDGDTATMVEAELDLFRVI